MRLSKHALTVLNAQYRSVLKKCLLINAGVFMAFSANAKTFTDNETWNENNTLNSALSENLEANGAKNVSIENTFVNGAGNIFSFIDSEISVINSDLETNYDPEVSDKKGNILIENTQFTYSCIGEDCKYGYEKDEDLGRDVFGPGNKAISGWDVTLQDNKGDKKIVLGTKGNYDDYAYLGANHNFTIENSTVELYGSSLLAYEGDTSDGVGQFEIKNSTITFNDKSSLHMGEDGAPSEAPLFITDSKITMNDGSDISFHGDNKADTTITNSNIHMNSGSKMALNNLSMEKSHILMKDNSKLSLNNLSLEQSHITLNGNSTLDVKDVKFDKKSSINGKNGQKNKIKFSGEVDFGGFFDPATADIDNIEADGLTRNTPKETKVIRGGYDDEITYNLNSGTLKYEADEYLYDSSKHKHNAGDTGRDENTNAFSDGNFALNSINFNGGALDIANGKVTPIKLASLKLSQNSDIMLDVDLAKKEMDRFTEDTPVEGDAKLNISKLNLVSDAKGERTEIEFTNNDKLKNAVNYENGKIQGYSPIYSYDVEYNDGNFTFTRGGGSNVSDFNPSVYAGSVVGQTLATIQSTIAQTAFSSLNNTLPQKDNAWVSVIGFDDTVDMKSFNNVDSEMYSVVGGVNSDVKHFNDFDATYGLYAGYINSEQKYSGNKINQNGGYVGLDSVLNRGNAELLASVNTGYIRNEDKHSFGNDKFDTYFTGVALKAGYTYSLDNGLSIVPSLYAGYTFVNNEDYTSKSGVKIKNDNLHLFEVAPGVKVNKDFNNGWTGYAQAKYAFIMDNGGNADVNNINLPNISAKDYVEYGLGANKALNDSWSLSAEINRRDGGREGWNGNLNIKYNF